MWQKGLQVKIDVVSFGMHVVHTSLGGYIVEPGLNWRWWRWCLIEFGVPVVDVQHLIGLDLIQYLLLLIGPGDDHFIHYFIFTQTKMRECLHGRKVTPIDAVLPNLFLFVAVLDFNPGAKAHGVQGIAV